MRTALHYILQYSVHLSLRAVIRKQIYHKIRISLYNIVYRYYTQTARPQRLQFSQTAITAIAATARGEKARAHTPRVPSENCQVTRNNAFRFYDDGGGNNNITYYCAQYNNNNKIEVCCRPRDTRKSDTTLIIGTDFATIDFGDFSYLYLVSAVRENSNTNKRVRYIYIYTHVIITISDQPNASG